MRTPAATASVTRRYRRLPYDFRGLPPPTGKAMANEVIEGDEWGAYVMLDTFGITGTRDRLPGASPKATESP